MKPFAKRVMDTPKYFLKGPMTSMEDEEKLCLAGRFQTLPHVDLVQSFCQVRGSSTTEILFVLAQELGIS